MKPKRFILACQGHHHPSIAVVALANPVSLWVITHGTSDLPGMFVVRHRLIGEGGHMAVEELPTAVVPTLDEARAALPLGRRRVPRTREDDPVIVESWM